MASIPLRVTTAIAAVTIFAGPNPAFAASSSVQFLQGGTVADAPEGFTDMCHRDRVLCAGGLQFAPDAAPVTAAVPPSAMITTATTVDPKMLAASATAPVATLQPAVFVPAAATPASVPAVTAVAAVAVPQPAIPSSVIDDKAMRKIARAVNRRVNGRVVQLSDLITHGQDEYWGLPRAWSFQREAGDCEDIAIEKRMQLLAEGFPADRLRYSVVYRRNFGLHLVLLAHFDDGDYVLDSATRRFDRWSDTPYVWLRVQDAANPLKWYNPATVSAPLILADAKGRNAHKAAI